MRGLSSALTECMSQPSSGFSEAFQLFVSFVNGGWFKRVWGKAAIRVKRDSGRAEDRGAGGAEAFDFLDRLR